MSNSGAMIVIVRTLGALLVTALLVASNRYNTLFSGMNIDGDGRIVHMTMFGVRARRAGGSVRSA